MKDKKKVTIIGIVGIIIVIVVALIVVFAKPKSFKISFDTDGGTTIESITVKQNDMIKLPEDPTKEGYVFDGWTLDGKKIDEKGKITKDITLKATWIKKEPDKIVITFDSKGGTDVESITINKGESLVLPKNPTREGYTFITWKDSNEIPIGNGANLDSDIELYAYWEKVKVKKPVEKPVEKPKKEYYCEDPKATLKGTLCVKEERKQAEQTCPKGSIEQKGKCFNPDDTSERHNNCKIHNGKKGVYNGDASGCFYGLETGPYNSPIDRETCLLAGHHFNSKDNQCYSELITNNYIVSCDKGYGLYNPPTNNTTCAKVVNSITTCEKYPGYKLSDNGAYCYKVVETKAKLR